MKRLEVDYSVTLLILLTVALGLAAQKRPDALLHGKSGASRRAEQREHAHRLPLYMMQLYRTMLTEERGKSTAASLRHTEDNTGLHDSDSVISLVAKGECSTSTSSARDSVCVHVTFLPLTAITLLFLNSDLSAKGTLPVPFWWYHNITLISVKTTLLMTFHLFGFNFNLIILTFSLLF